MDDRRSLGRWGEAEAARFLEAHGYQIVARNWRYPRLGEIDLVAQWGAEPLLVFVEVRVRRGLAYGTPEESITATKKARLKALAEAYVQAHAWAGSWRIDVVAVELDHSGRLVRQQHIQNAISD